MRVQRLRINHLRNPLGFKIGKPAFSWRVGGSAGTKAEASRIRVARGGALVADTGWANLDSLAAHVDDLVLEPRTRYEWTVAVRSDAGEEAVSEPAWFETGKMDEPWQAAWIVCDGEESPRHPVFFTTAELKGEVVQARLYACGLGVYDAYVNDERVSDEYLAPGTNAYDQWLQVQTYDVTKALRTSNKTPKLSFAMGNGWWKGRFGFIPEDRGFYGNDWLLIAELHVTYADSTEEVFSTGEGWQVGRSNVYASNIYDGEYEDDTLPVVAPVPVALLTKDDARTATAKLTDRLSLPVTAHEIFEPVVVDVPSGDLVLDMGQEFAGTFRLRVHEPAGTTVHVWLGELLQDGEFYNENLRSAKQEFVYVSDGEEQVLEPRFTYYGYRYVKIEGLSSFTPSDLTGVALYSDFEETGALTTGHELVNKLISNTRWGMKSNFVDTPTDCPQRDERMGWTGDAQVFAPTALYLADQLPFYLLHGMFGNYTDWVANTRVQRWAEERNLAVIMPSGDNMYYVNSLLAFNDYGAFVGEELPQIMRAMFPLSSRREDTFIAGLSMGGFGAMRNGFTYAETFSRIAALSSALTVLDPTVPPIAGDKDVFGDLAVAAQTDKNYQVAYNKLRERVAAGDATMPMVYLACGTEDGFLPSTRTFRDQLVSDGVDVTYDEQPGGHDWDFWDAQIKKVIDWLPLDDAAQGFGSGAID